METLAAFPTALGPNDADDGPEGRRLRGLAISATVAIRKSKVGYVVPSQSNAGSYVVSVDDGGYCTCPDYEKRQQPCKHFYAVVCTIQREELSDGTIRETTKAVSVKYTRDWSAYNAAQMNEGKHFKTLLRSLCDSVPNVDYTFGRPNLPLSDILYALCYRAYSGKSGRRMNSEIEELAEQGLLEKAPSFAVLGKYMVDSEITPVVQNLITLSSLPLRAVERDFAIDSTGFASGSYTDWNSEKWGGEEKKKKVWVKASFTTGVKTNIIVRADVTVHPHGDAPYLIPHLNTVGEHFAIDEFSADKGYISKSNLTAIEDAGAKAYIPFRKNAVPHLVMDEGDEVWNRLLAYYVFNRAEFDSRYHKRSNVESSIGAIKAKLHEKLRSKTGTGMVNEVLLKVLAYNLTALVRSMYELGITPEFDGLALAGGVPVAPVQEHSLSSHLNYALAFG